MLILTKYLFSRIQIIIICFARYGRFVQKAHFCRFPINKADVLKLEGRDEGFTSCSARLWNGPSNDVRGWGVRYEAQASWDSVCLSVGAIQSS